MGGIVHGVTGEAAIGASRPFDRSLSATFGWKGDGGCCARWDERACGGHRARGGPCVGHSASRPLG